jgi:hypothetical protein
MSKKYIYLSRHIKSVSELYGQGSVINFLTMAIYIWSKHVRVENRRELFSLQRNCVAGSYNKQLIHNITKSKLFLPVLERLGQHYLTFTGESK